MSVIVERNGPYDQFLLFGDSLTQQSASQDNGFAFMPALQNDYIRRLDVINRGFSGYNTNQALAVLPSFMPEPLQANIRFMVVFFGANDACLRGSPTGQHVPLDKYIENLKNILHHATMKKQNPRLILITPPPIDEHLLSLNNKTDHIAQSRTAQHTKKYADACRELGRSQGIAVLDLWTVFMKRAGWKEGDGEENLPGSIDSPQNETLKQLLSDGLHFKPLSYKIMHQELNALIRHRWPDQTPNTNDFVFEPWENFTVD